MRLPNPPHAIRPIAIALLALFLTSGVLGTAPADVTRHGGVLAVEDTMRTEVPEVMVRARRVTLDEILDRVARGEARRDSLMRDQSFTATLRVLRNTAGAARPELWSESVYRVYKRKPDSVRAVELRRVLLHPDEADDDDADSFSPGMGEQIVNFAFRAENRDRFRFTIEDRRILGDHLVYTLRFEPRSSLTPYEPSGRVWVDTQEDVILRQEIAFAESPVPLFVKRIPHMVIERTQVDDLWVLSRALVRLEFTVPMPKLGRSVDFVMAMSGYEINRDLPDSLFTGTRAAGSNGRAARRQP